MGSSLFCLSLYPAVFIAAGLVLILKKDWAWRFVELMMRSIQPRRTPEWERTTTLNGAFMILVGLALILFIWFGQPLVLQGP
jgi:hypothetical protein